MYPLHQNMLLCCCWLYLLHRYWWRMHPYCSSSGIFWMAWNRAEKNSQKKSFAYAIISKIPIISTLFDCEDHKEDVMVSKLYLITCLFFSYSLLVCTDQTFLLVATPSSVQDTKNQAHPQLNPEHENQQRPASACWLGRCCKKCCYTSDGTTVLCATPRGRKCIVGSALGVFGVLTATLIHHHYQSS